MMISTDSLRSAISSAETDFLTCWDVLTSMKYGPIPGDFAEKALRFQPLLAKAIFKLDQFYRELRRAEHATVERKGSMVRDEFPGEMRRLASYRVAIKETLALGRALGDAFAWFFYRKSQYMLEKHVAHAAIRHSPPGIGGRGELAFISNIRPDGAMLLFHGITTFLRLGDVSFVDLKRGDVVALGELKTIKQEGNQYSIQLHMIGSDKTRIPLQTVTPTPGTNEPSELSPRFKRRLDQQLKAMVPGLRDKPAELRSSILDGYHVDSLQNLSASLETNNYAYEQAGEGLLLVGLKVRPEMSFTDRLMSSEDLDLKESLRDLPAKAVQLMDLQSTDNSILMGALSFRFQLGCAPLFWLPVSADFTRELYFGGVVIQTIYNPSYFQKRLKQMGFRIEGHIGEPNCKIERSLEGGRVTGLENVLWFLSAIRNHLLKEDKVIEMLSELMGRTERGEIPVNSKVQFQMSTHFM